MSSDSDFSNSDDSNISASDVEKDQEHAVQKQRRRRRNDDGDDLPDQFVRKDDQRVRCARIVVFVVLLLATILTSGVVYDFVSDAEQEKFVSDFDAVSDRIVDAMEYDFAHKVWGTRTIAKSLTALMIATGASHTNLTIPQWLGITDQARYIALHNLISWSPILRTEEERAQFEDSASKDPMRSQDKKHPACYLCDDPRFGFINQDTTTEIQGIGVRRCGGIDDAARDGGMNEKGCIFLRDVLDGVCICSSEPMYEAQNKTGNEGGSTKANGIFRLEDGQIVEETNQGSVSPMWYVNYRTDNVQSPVMWNQMSDPIRQRALTNMQDAALAVLSETFIREGDYAELYSGNLGEPAVVIFFPVENSQNEIVGSVTAELNWEDFGRGSFPQNSDSVDVVIENSCGQSHTYSIDTNLNTLRFKGEGDLHEEKYEDMVHMSSFEDFEETIRLASEAGSFRPDLEHCRYRFLAYATSEMENKYKTEEPMIYSAIVVVIFFFTAVVFVFYDCLVVRRQRKVMDTATRSAALVSTLFPKTVRNRLYEQGGAHDADKAEGAAKPIARSGTRIFSGKTRLHRFLNNTHDGQVDDSEPIADLFPSATVMFLDIAGFTAWSSERDPTQVLRLLETIYNSFDRIAKRLGVFKVETIGDSYLAVAGLPEPRPDHAVVMAKFAYACMRRMAKLTKELVSTLGPSTGDLKARCGLHSGPVTAGVLRGDKARFQLFGDTVNTASRMESKGMPDKIQASQKTVDLLCRAGKESWYTPREELVIAKGKGELQTYWVTPRTGSTMSTASRSSSASTSETLMNMSHGPRELPMVVTVNRHLVEWNVDFLYVLLENIARQRVCQATPQDPLPVSWSHESSETVFDEMVEVVRLPPFQPPVPQKESLDIVDYNVKGQLREFVTTIASLYRNVPFHNFEHASHVTMSAGKLMKRILRPDGVDDPDDHPADLDASLEIDRARRIHDMTYGLSSDPLTQFAIVFSALIHDVDHTGLPNSQLIKMKTTLAQAYRNKSVAEQNSVDVAWSLLMDDSFRDLRNCIYQGDDEMKRFRQVVINSVMATDIADKELQRMRKQRWEVAFSTDDDDANNNINGSNVNVEQSTSEVHRKATIVFEYIIQASDVAHTMQHWHIYRRWNERLFEECYGAWASGQADKDPADTWYTGELWFFDNYVIPLAERLHKCGVFGVSYHESLHYAMENRKEWELKGKQIVEMMSSKCQQQQQAIIVAPPGQQQQKDSTDESDDDSESESGLVSI